MIKKFLTSSVIFSMLIFSTLAFNEQNMQAFKQSYFKNSSKMAYPMNAVKEGFIGYLGTLDLFENQLTEFHGITEYDDNSFTLVATYLIRQESKYYQNAKDRNNIQLKAVTANVRVIFENPPDQSTDVTDLFRYNLGLAMAYQTCNAVQSMDTMQFNYISQNTEASEMIGLYPPYGRPFRANIQKFYEQSINLMEIDVNETQEDFLVTILVTEAYTSTLDVPVQQNYQSANTNDLVNVLVGLANIGESIYGMKMLHGDISLGRIGLDVVTKNDQQHGVINVLKPILLLSDNMRNLNNNFKAQTDYVDDVLRYEADYRAPWITQNVQKAMDQRTNLFTYTWELKEDGFALLQTIFNFIKINNISKNRHVIKVVNDIKKEFPGDLNDPQNVPNCDQISTTIIYALKASGFIKNRILI